MRVWIEMAVAVTSWTPTEYRFTLLWGCGLKYFVVLTWVHIIISFTLLWGCGLKFPRLPLHQSSKQFHPLMRVWIEIAFSGAPNASITFHPLMRVWIEIHILASLPRRASCFTLLWGCGLKFPRLPLHQSSKQFHPLMRVWIEIHHVVYKQKHYQFHPLMRVWIEITTQTRVIYRNKVSPSYEGVDWNR